MAGLKIVLVVALACVASVWGKAVTLTPQMGWNSWNKFACNISESLIKETADALVATGLAALGYNYMNLDDCWHASSRDSQGRLQADPVRFPSGMKAVGDYIHSKGLKFGIYSSAGFKTCQGFPASLGLEEIDAQTYADWGVDYLKYDNCYQDYGLPQVRYPAMSEALEATGRDIFYSLCEWGRENPAVWAPGMAQSWRISGDIRDEWRSIKTRAEIGASLWRYSGPNLGWNDPDMLEVGNGGCNQDEYRTHFSLWAMLKAPLIIGNDIRSMAADSYVMDILGNKELIAVNQDRLGRQGRITWSDTTAELLPKVGFGGRLTAAKCATGAAGANEDPKERQVWEFTSEGFIRNAVTDQCLREHSALLPRAADWGDYFNFSIGLRGVSAAPCAQATQWAFEQFKGGSIVSKTSGLCLEVEKFEFVPAVQGKRLQTAPCQVIHNSNVDIREHQSWTHVGNKALRNLYQRQCLTADRDAFPGVAKEVWVGQLDNGALAALLINKSPIKARLTLSVDMLGLDDTGGVAFAARDLWAHQDLRQPLSEKNTLDFVVPAHGSVMLKLSRA